MFTAKTKIGEILSQPEFANHKHMTGMYPEFNGAFSVEKTLSGISQAAGWNVDPIVDGLNYLHQHTKAGKVFYDIYTDVEQAAAPGKQQTGLAAFPLPEKRPFAIVCAGGGYSGVCSMAEAYPVIQKLNQMGYSAFSLCYRCGRDAIAPNPMEDLAQAVRFILSHAEEWNVETRNYAVMGFSAGGHLAASFGTESLGYAHYGEPAPAALMLCYPVITMGNKTNEGSRQLLLGDRSADAAAQTQYSIECQVTAQYPPSYVWQFDADDTVPIENSRMLTQALRKNGVPYQYETFPGTLHGAGIGTGTLAEGWLERAVAFWKDHMV